MRILIILSIILSLVFVSTPGAFAKTNHTTIVQNFGSIFNHIFNIANTGGNTGGSVHTGNAIAVQSVTNVINTTGSPCCTSVPEFGMIPGIVAAITSGGAFYYLKRKKYN